MNISTNELKDIIGRAFDAGWEKGQGYMTEDAELRADRIPVGPKGMRACRDDYVGDETYDFRRVGDE